jgi:transposase
MPKKYDEPTRAKAVRLVQEHRDDYGSEYEAIKAIAGRLGMNPETVRKWLRQAEVEAGQVDGTTTAAAREIRELKRKNAELVHAIAPVLDLPAVGQGSRGTATAGGLGRSVGRPARAEQEEISSQTSATAANPCLACAPGGQRHRGALSASSCLRPSAP